MGEQREADGEEGEGERERETKGRQREVLGVGWVWGELCECFFPTENKSKEAWLCYHSRLAWRFCFHAAV